MKKQYLISLLGLAAISVPLGSSLLDTNTKLLSPVVSETTNFDTGVTIDEDSKITVWDMDKDGSVTKGDQIESFTFNTTYDTTGETTTPDLTPNNAGGLNIYYGEDKTPDLNGEDTNQEKFKVTFEELINSGAIIDNTAGTFKLEANAADNTKGKYDQIWGTPIVNADSFVVTMDTTYTEPKTPTIEIPTRSTNQEVEIGTVGFSEEVVNDSVDSTITINTQPSENVTNTSASVGYDIKMGTDVHNNNLTLKNVEWFDKEDGTLLASSKKSSDILTTDKLVSNGTKYDESIIVVTEEDSAGNTTQFTSKQQIEEFTTLYDVIKPSIEQTSDEVNVINSSSASVDYNVNSGQTETGETTDILYVTWFNDDSDGGDQILAMSEYNPKASGTLTTNKLNEDTNYENTRLIATMDDNVHYYDVEVDNFQTPFEVINTEIEQTSEVTQTSETEASVNYKVTPGQDINGDVTVEKVSWMNGKDELATSTKTKGKLSTDKLVTGETYNTIIKVEMSDGVNVNPIEVEEFTVLFDIKESKIEQTKDVEVISQTEAEVGYKVTPGQDINGDVTVEKVSWMNGKEELATSTKTNGKLSTDKLVAGKTYNTTIKVEMSDGVNVNPIEVEEFTAFFDVIPETTVKQTNDVNVESASKASIDYEITPGQTELGPIDILYVTWFNDDSAGGDQILAMSEYNPEASGTLTTNKLNKDTNYENTRLIATMDDNVHYYDVEVTDFTTDFSKPSTIKQTSDVLPTSPTDATLAYKINPGKNSDGNGIYVKEVRWLNGEDELANSTDNLISGDLVKGTLTTNKLEANKEYNDTTLIAKMSDGTTTETDVNDFNEGNVAPEVNQIHHVKVDYNNDILDVKGTIDTNGSEIQDIYFVKDEDRIHTDYIDNDVNQAANSNEVTYDMWTKEYTGEMDEEGNPDLDGYSIVIDYGTEIFEEPLSMTSTDDHSTSAAEQATEEDLNYLKGDDNKKTNSQLGAGAVIAIIISILLLIGIIVWMGNFLYKKYYNESKPALEANEQEQVENKDTDQVENKDDDQVENKDDDQVENKDEDQK